MKNLIKKANSNNYELVTIKVVSKISNEYSKIITKTYNITNGYGNGKLDFLEECDDGNINNNDGCSSNGLLEKGYNCCPDINGKDICKTLENSLPYTFQQLDQNFLVAKRLLLVNVFAKHFLYLLEVLILSAKTS